MANTEDIEAKLTAYIDGELDAAGRAEIEKHLEANPRHRQLLVELTRTRDMLRALPIESAPPDIAESLHNQLERAVLLGAVDEPHEHVVLRISRWPQLTAVAAIVLLAVGLGIVVYYVLPAESPGPDFALMESTLPETDGVPPSASIDALSKSLPEDRIDPADAFEPGNRPMPFVPFTQPEEAAPVTGGTTPLFNAGVETAPAASRETPDAVLVVVNTRDPHQANLDVANYLKDNRIRWQSVPEPMPEPLDIGPFQVLRASRLNRTTVEAERMRQSVVPPPDEAPEAAAHAPHRDEPDAAQSKLHVGLAEAVMQDGADDQDSPAALVDEDTQALVRQQLANLKSTETQGHYTIDNLYVARGLTRRQAEELTQALSGQRADQMVYSHPTTAPVIAPVDERQEHDAPAEGILPAPQAIAPQATEAPTTAPAMVKEILPADSALAVEEVESPPAVLASQDVLVCRITGLEGIAPLAAQTVRIDEEGMIFLPLIGPVRAAGLTVAQLQSVVTNEYSRLPLAAAPPSVSVSRVEPPHADDRGLADLSNQAATTQPAAEADHADVEETPALSPEAFPMVAPVNQPAPKASEEERVDVVIVVQNAWIDPEPSSAAPSTQPSTDGEGDEPPSAPLPDPAVVPAAPASPATQPAME